MKAINVLSLFDGISTGFYVLEKSGIKINQYYSSEIDKGCISISNKNFPNQIRLGSVENWKDWNIDFKNIDLLIGGSPCQGFSFAGKGLNFSDERSKLFFKYLEILNFLKEQNPNVKFLLENVNMKKEFKNKISSYLNTEYLDINSNLVSAQNRRRLYWTNIADSINIKDKQIYLKDIIHESFDKNKTVLEFLEMFDLDYKDFNKFLNIKIKDYLNIDKFFFQKVLKDFLIDKDKTDLILQNEINRNKIKYLGTDLYKNDLYSIHGKKVCLFNKNEKTSINNDFLFSCLTPDKIKQRQNGQRFNDGNKFFTLTATDRHGIFYGNKYCSYIRKLTPIECERLQTLPDNYTKVLIKNKIISNSKRIQTLGNGWTADAICELLSKVKDCPELD